MTYSASIRSHRHRTKSLALGLAVTVAGVLLTLSLVSGSPSHWLTILTGGNSGASGNGTPSHCIGNCSSRSPETLPPAFPLELGSFQSSNAGGLSYYNASIQVVNTSTTASDLQFESKSTSCAIAGGISSYRIIDASGVTIATENASTSIWNVGATSVLPVGGTLSIVSSVSLPSDELLIRSGAQTSVFPLSSSAEAIGCSF